MKTAETKISTNNHGKTSAFFQKESNNDFFNKKNNSFFNASPIQAKLTVNQPNDPYEKEADTMADKVVQRVSNKSFPGTRDTQKTFFTKSNLPAQRKCAECEKEEKNSLQTKPGNETAASAPASIESSLNASKGSGNTLPHTARAQMENSFGVDFSNVRIHNDSNAVNMNKDLNAQAFTHGDDIYFNAGKYDTEGASGQHLLAHELTHVVQQNDGIKEKHIVQRTLAQSMPTVNGAFGIDMQTQTFATNNRTGLTGTIDFTPAVNAPYSNEISLIQIARLRDANTGKDVAPVALAGTTGTNPLLTQDNPAKGAKGGFFTDVLHSQAGVFQDLPLSPGYRFSTVNQNAAGACTGGNPQIHGFKRSNDPADIHEATMADCPGVQDNSSNLDFKFETVAKGTDTNLTYGSLSWEFKTRAGKVIDENAFAVDNQSGTFDQAIARHQDFYTHESLVFYFDFDHDNLTASEQVKLNAEVIDYLGRFPDVRITISGFADSRGSAAYNVGLANRRANNVAQLFITKGGLLADRINPLNISGSTEQFTNDAVTDQDTDANRRGNRRVTVEFEHTASVPLPGQI